MGSILSLSNSCFVPQHQHKPLCRKNTWTLRLVLQRRGKERIFLSFLRSFFSLFPSLLEDWSRKASGNREKGNWLDMRTTKWIFFPRGKCHGIDKWPTYNSSLTWLIQRKRSGKTKGKRKSEKYKMPSFVKMEIIKVLASHYCLTCTNISEIRLIRHAHQNSSTQPAFWSLLSVLVLQTL